MLFPKKVKHRKWQTKRENPKKIGVATRGVEVNFGSYGLKATSAYRMTSNQIESARKVISKTLGKTGRMWTRVFPDRPYTQKASEMPMGKGKGEPQGFCVEIKPGRILFEVDGVTEEIAKSALIKAGKKLPVTIRVVGRE